LDAIFSTSGMTGTETRVRSFAHRGVKAAGVGLIAAAMLAAGALAPRGGAASSDGSYGAQAAKAFKKCRAGQAKLKRNGILHLRGAKSPKGFACVTGEGGNQLPVKCARGRQQVRFTLEG
jgi:hypothetical protein